MRSEDYCSCHVCLPVPELSPFTIDPQTIPHIERRINVKTHVGFSQCSGVTKRLLYILVAYVCLSLRRIPSFMSNQSLHKRYHIFSIGINVKKYVGLPLKLLCSGVTVRKPSERANMQISTGLPRDACYLVV